MNHKQSIEYPLSASISSLSDHAKLLWQRIPKSVKQEHKEISELWEIGKRLWRKEFAAVYELTRNPKWPSHLEPLVTSIVGESAFFSKLLLLADVFLCSARLNIYGNMQIENMGYIPDILLCRVPKVYYYLHIV